MSVPEIPAPQAGFMTHVVEQYVHRLGAPASDPAGERGVALRVCALVDDAGDASTSTDPSALRRRERGAHDLANDPALLAAFFQNIDLLYADRFHQADAVSALVLRALELSALLPPAPTP